MATIGDGLWQRINCHWSWDVTVYEVRKIIANVPGFMGWCDWYDHQQMGCIGQSKTSDMVLSNLFYQDMWPTSKLLSVGTSLGFRHSCYIYILSYSSLVWDVNYLPRHTSTITYHHQISVAHSSKDFRILATTDVRTYQNKTQERAPRGFILLPAYPSIVSFQGKMWKNGWVSSTPPFFQTQIKSSKGSKGWDG